MVKGYWIVSVDISSPESHKVYVAETRSALRKYGARFVVRGGKSEVVEGSDRSVMIMSIADEQRNAKFVSPAQERVPAGTQHCFQCLEAKAGDWLFADQRIV